MLQLSSKLPLGKGQEALSSLSTPSDTRQSLASTRRKGRRLRKTHCQGSGSQALPKAEGPSGEHPAHTEGPLYSSRAADSCQWSRNIIQATHNTKWQQYSTGEISGLRCTEGDISNRKATPSSTSGTNYHIVYHLKWVFKHLTSYRRKFWNLPHNEKMINGNSRCSRQSLSRVRLFATPMDCSLPGSSVHAIFQARVLEWVAISFSRGSSRPRDQTWVSRIVGRGFTIWATKEDTFLNY